MLLTRNKDINKGKTTLIRKNTTRKKGSHLKEEGKTITDKKET